MLTMAENNRSHAGMLVTSSRSTINNYKKNSNGNHVSSVESLKNSKDDSSISKRKSKAPVRSNSLLNTYNSKDPSANHTHENVEDDYASTYRLSNFIIRVEQIPQVWVTDAANGKSIKVNVPNQKSQQIIDRDKRRSFRFHSLTTSSEKSLENESSFNTLLTPRNINENSNKKSSPQHRLRHSYSNEAQSKSMSNDNLNTIHSDATKLCRSPVLTRRSQQQKFKAINSDIDVKDLIFQPTVLVSLFTHDRILQMNNINGDPSIEQTRIKNASSTVARNVKKRLYESSSSEKILVKRRYQQADPTIITQDQLCIAYPKETPQCIDCRTVNSLNPSIRSASCRFQHCRKLKYLGDDRYAVEGFITVDEAKFRDIKNILTPDSGAQSPMNLINASHIFQHLAQLFCLLVLHEENERKLHINKTIIWKPRMPGWREVCDACTTTLYNCHYMCMECGYMRCIECSNESIPMYTEKRKKIRRTCNHDDRFSLSEFIPWIALTKLRDDCLNYLTKLKMSYSIKLNELSRSENNSMFIKTLQIKRVHDETTAQKHWSSVDCCFDRNIEFYCNGRLPVFNEWTSENAKSFFQKVWAASCPVLVKKVHHNLSKTLWQPDSFKLHMIHHKETPLLWDCQTLTPIEATESVLIGFWEGFERLTVRLKDDANGGRSRILKLKDWPTKADFGSVFPERLHDLMANIPFGDYTRRSYMYNGAIYPGGIYNVVERLPTFLVKPDLGPKLYIAYSQLTSQESKKAGTTNLHIDASDAVNVLVYVGVGGKGHGGLDKSEELQQVEAEVLEANIDEMQLQRLRNGEKPGALWHIFRTDDAKKIREYIGRTRRKVLGTDAIHDQNAYLEREDLEKLREFSNVEVYPVLQFLGDAVFIPSGAPHQVKNLHSCIKIAGEFVSPENLDRCLISTNEYRSLSKTHTNHADTIQAKNILHYTIRDTIHAFMASDKSGNLR